MKATYKIDWEMHLKSVRLKVTLARLEILKALENESAPVKLNQLPDLLVKSIDRITLYRSFESLEKAGLIHQSGLGYESAVGRAHHHHAVCTECGLIEDIEIPHREYPETDALKASLMFSHISSYVFDFFGICKKCA